LPLRGEGGTRRAPPQLRLCYHASRQEDVRPAAAYRINPHAVCGWHLPFVGVLLVGVLLPP